jgi:hypothetical protein
MAANGGTSIASLLLLCDLERAIETSTLGVSFCGFGRVLFGASRREQSHEAVGHWRADERIVSAFRD